MGKEFIDGQMDKFTMVNGKMTKCMDMESSKN